MWRRSGGTFLRSAKEIPGRTNVPGEGRLVVPGNSGLEISAGQMGRPDPRDQGLAADIVTESGNNNQQV